MSALAVYLNERIKEQQKRHGLKKRYLLVQRVTPRGLAAQPVVIRQFLGDDAYENEHGVIYPLLDLLPCQPMSDEDGARLRAQEAGITEMKSKIVLAN